MRFSKQLESLYGLYRFKTLDLNWFDFAGHHKWSFVGD